MPAGSDSDWTSLQRTDSLVQPYQPRRHAGEYTIDKGAVIRLKIDGFEQTSTYLHSAGMRVVATMTPRRSDTMLKPIQRCALALFVPVMGAHRAVGQSCAPRDIRTVRLADQLRIMVSDVRDPWPTIRDSTHVPPMSSGLVSVETKTAVCKRAAQAYDRELQRMHGTPATARKINLVRVGNSYYAANDPSYRVPGSEWTTVIFFTSDFVFLSSWTR